MSKEEESNEQQSKELEAEKQRLQKERELLEKDRREHEEREDRFRIIESRRIEWTHRGVFWFKVGLVQLVIAVLVSAAVIPFYVNDPDRTVAEARRDLERLQLEEDRRRLQDYRTSLDLQYIKDIETKIEVLGKELNEARAEALIARNTIELIERLGKLECEEDSDEVSQRCAGKKKPADSTATDTTTDSNADNQAKAEDDT